MPKNLILGAGPCGLGAALRLNELNQRDWLILESLDHPGGLASSYIDSKGFTWDVGGHVQFSHYADFDRIMDKALPNGWLTHQRESWVWMLNRFIPYPFQNNLWRLPDSERAECVKGLENIKSTGVLSNFEEWIDQSFGAGIARLFMKPYNYKVWAYPPSQMNFQWIGERVAQVDLARVKKNIELQTDDVSWGPNAIFRFPKTGGTGAIWKTVAKIVGEDKIRYKQKVVQIDSVLKKVKLESGEEISYDSLLSTMPLNKLCLMVGEPMQKSLLSSNSHIIGIGLKGKTPKDLETKCWMYFPEADTPFYRVTVFSNYSPANVPDIESNWSLMCEVSSSPAKKVNEAELVDECIKGLLKIKFIQSKAEVVSTWQFAAKPGYPTPSIGRDEIIHENLKKLEAKKIYSRGRFGVWKYEVSNQDHTFMQGFEWADFVIRGLPEDTAFSPAKVNAPGLRPLRSLS